MVMIKGYEIPAPKITDTHDRRALQCKNKIIAELKRLGVTEDQSDIPMVPYAFQNVPASVTWYLDGHHLYYSYRSCKNFAENLSMVHKVLALFIDKLLTKEIDSTKFVSEFREDDDDVAKSRKEARELLGVDAKEIDMAVIDKKYKDLAKAHHPDMDGGDTEKFKAINKAHKVLKRELS